MVWDRKKLQSPRKFPKVNRPKIEGEITGRIELVIGKMLLLTDCTQYQDILYRFKGVIRPVIFDYGLLPYVNFGAVRNKNPMECLLSMLARIYHHWWRYLAGKNQSLDPCETTIKHLEDIVANWVDYTPRYTEKLGWRLVRDGEIKEKYD